MYQLMSLCIVLAFISACSSNYSTALLLSDPDNNKVYTPVKQGEHYLGGNPIYIGRDTKFTVEINKIAPGWLARASRAQSATGSEKQSSIDHFKDKELWVLTRISSVTPVDPMEMQSKQYFKASNVKFQSEAYAIIPLDHLEKVVFTHLSDTAYRITFEVYEIDNFDLKREVSLAGQDPGIAGILTDAAKTTVNVVGAVAGEYISRRWEKYSNEPLAMERLLLRQGAVKEFTGKILIQRSDLDFAQLYPGELLSSRTFILLDHFKSMDEDDIESSLPSHNTLQGKKSHATAIQAYRDAACVMETVVQGEVCHLLTDPRLAFIQLNIIETAQGIDLKASDLNKAVLAKSQLELSKQIRDIATNVSTLLSSNNLKADMQRVLVSNPSFSSIEPKWTSALQFDAGKDKIADLATSLQAAESQVELVAVSILGSVQLKPRLPQFIAIKAALQNNVPVIKRWQELEKVEADEGLRRQLQEQLRLNYD